MGLYKVKTVTTGKESPKKVKSSEAMLKDLLMVIPTLKKHSLEGEIMTQVRKLRDGRKSEQVKLELSRIYKGKELKVSKVLPKETKKGPSQRITILRDLKAQIRDQIREMRKKELPPIENYTFREGVVVRKLAEVYLETNTFVKVMAKKIRLDMTKSKKPKTTDNYIGVEIELASKLDRNQLCDILFEEGLGKYLTVKDDGSIGSGTNLRNEYAYAHEICVLVRQSEYEEILTKLCKTLNDRCQVKVDKTCGLHVHLDMRARDVKKSFSNLVNMQQFLYAMLPKARRDSKYSYPVKGAEYRALDQRYYGINSQAYDKYGTLEIRMHCGTTQGKKIVSWIKLLLLMVEANKVTKAPTDLDTLQQAIGADAELMSYVAARINKFATQHRGATYSAEQPGTMPDIVQPTHAPIDDTVTEQSEVA